MSSLRCTHKFNKRHKIVIAICFHSELWDDKVNGWINEGEPNKKYKEQF